CRPVSSGVSASLARWGLAMCGGQGRGRTADLPIFSRTLVPTELPGRACAPSVHLTCANMTPEGSGAGSLYLNSSRLQHRCEDAHPLTAVIRDATEGAG